MPFYSVSFGYGGPKTNFPHENEDGSMSDASKVCFAADDVCEKLGKKLGLNLLHQYSFPDGSLYKYVKDERTAAEVKALLSSALPEWMLVHSVDEIPPNTDPWKAGFKTVEAYFAEGAGS